MARDNYNEVKGKNTYSTKKKKKKKETATKKVQSPSVSSQQRTADPKEARRQESQAQAKSTVKKVQSTIQKAQQTALARRTAGQNQKTYGNTEGVAQTITIPKRTAQQKAEDRARGQRVKSGIQTAEDERKIRERNEHRVEVAKNTGRASVKGAKDTVTGYAKTMADVDEMAKSNEKWTEAKAMKLGVDRNDRKKMAEIEKERQESIKQSREFRMDLQRKQEERQAKFDEQTKDASELEKALYGAAESGTGMLIDTGIGAVTGTGQIGALASMGLRTYGTTRGQAEKEGATEGEDRLYSLAQAGKEVGTELMFQGAGLAKGYAVSKSGKAVGLSFADKAANALTKGLTGKKADVVSAGVKLLEGTGEENVEELAGWMADPLIKEAIYGRNVRKRTAESLRANLPEVTSKEDADRVAAYFSTDKFEADLTQEYINSGLSKKEASELAQEMRDYYVAYYSNDEETLNTLEEDLAQKLSGQQKLSKSSWSMDELMDTFASTTLLTLGTGLPGGITSSVKGNQMFDSEDSFLRKRFGDNAVKIVTDAVKNTSDAEMSAKAQAMEKRLSEGKDLTGTQKYELAQGYMEKVRETGKKAEASNGVVVQESRKNDYVPTQMINQKGERVFAKETQKAYDKEYESASKTVDDLKGSISETDMDRADAVKKAVADLHVGGLTVGDAHEFGYGNELARETLKKELGIDLDQYVVKTKDGKIDYAATNDATENALFELNAQNAIDMAKVETDVYIDDMKGEIDTDLLSRFGGNAQTVWKDVNQDLDPHRDLKGYLATADAVSFFVSAGRNTDLSVEEIMKRYANVGMNKSVDDSIKRQAIEAGRQDRIDANTPGNGQTVEAGQKIALKKTEKITTGELIIEEGLVIPDSDQQVYKALADATNANIHLVSTLSPLDENGKPIIDKKTGKPIQLNGMSHGNDIYLNFNESAEKNLGYVFMHEMTHQIKQYAPNEYLALENLVRDRWFNKDQKSMDRMIKDRIALYSTKGGQTLTEEEAVEEIIADAMAEAMDDPNFASEVCEQNLDLAEQILSAIRSALRSIRQMFAGGKTNGTRFHNGLLSYLGILDDAERMWLDALAVAKQNKANGLIADWQDKVNKQNSPRLSAEIEANESRYSIVTDPEVIKELEEDSHVTTYRAMALIDGKLYPPMSTKEKNEKGRWTLKQGMDLGQWVESDITTDSRMFNKEGEFILKKDDGSSDMGVAYNPYIHSSDSMMNDQFSTAYRRPNLVVVEGEIPESELTNGYRAEHDLDDGRHVVAKDSTGITDWKAGEVQAKLSGKRTVYLTQHFKPTRIVPDSEVAQHINDKVAGTDIAIPYNVVTPSVRRELQKLGTRMEQNKQKKYYVEGAERFSITPEQDAEYMSAVESGDMDKARQMVYEAADKAMPDSLLREGQAIEIGDEEDGTLLRMYHGSGTPNFTEFNLNDGMLGNGAYFASDWTEAGDYAIGSLVDAGEITELENGDYEWDGDTYDTGSLIEALEDDGYVRAFYVDVTDEEDISDSHYGWGNVIALARTKEQIKSADPVTYDDEGNVIPLSERFNQENPDIRYSIPEETVKELEDNDVKVLEGGSVAHYSLTSLKAEKEAKIRKALKDAGTFTDEQIDKWIDDIWSIASIVENNRDTLDYWADRSVSSKKSNQAYMYSFDFSTLCPKRTIYQGTLNAIYKMLPNAILMPDDLIHLRKLLKNKGYQAPCGFCYVESERKWLDQKVGEFLKQYKGDYIPKPTELTATDSKIKEEHPEAWNAWIKYRGKLGQGGPRLVDPRTDYRGEILRMRPETVKKLNDIGGLRFQSYSDFEVYHMLDMMQAIRDAAAMGLKVQMYTKIPACAEIFGATGIKINLSLVAATNEDGSFAKDENGNLIFDSQEGMPYEEAMRLRDMYPENVGTILVGHSRQHIIEAMADDRIDFIIPFHKSGWSMKEFAELGLGGYEDVAAVTHEDREKYIETGESAEEIYSGSYWEYDKPGKWNAEKYLRICKERKVTPSFYSFLQDNDDGSWSLKEDGSTDGYWKLLIDGKMYDNDGKGSPQKPVKPEFNIEAAKKLMDDTIKNGGSADTLPVADDVVEAFVKEYVQNHPDAKVSDARLSISAKLDDDYMSAVNSGNMEEAQRLVDEAAQMSMPNTKLKGKWYHGTENTFTVFNFSQGGKNGTADGYGIYLTNDPKVAESYGNIMIEGYVNVERPASVFKRTLSDIELRRLIERTVDIEAETLQYEGYDSIGKAKFDTWISNYTDTYYAGNIDKAIGEVVKTITQFNNNDYDIVLEIMAGMGIRDYDRAIEFYDVLTEETGIDGFETKWGDESEMADPNTPTIALAFRSNQIKSADTITYAEDGSVIPLSQRFDPNNNDIRYSMPTQDSEGRVLSDGQMEYFANSQARDEQGRLVPVYHSTNRAGFTVFDPHYSDDHRSFFFTDNYYVSQTYAEDGFVKAEEYYEGENITDAGYYTCYLNLENPFIIDARGKNWDNISNSALGIVDREWEKYTDDDGKLKVGYSDNGGDFVEITDEEAEKMLGWDLYDKLTVRWFEGDYGSISTKWDTQSNTIGEASTTRSLSEYAYANGYDGVIIKNVVDVGKNHFNGKYHGVGKIGTDYIAFSSNQIKDINNENPTENPDIRYSIPDRQEALDTMIAKADSIDIIPLRDTKIEEQRVKYSLSVKDFENMVISGWDEHYRTFGRLLDDESVKPHLISMMSQIMKDSETGRKYKTETLDETIKDMKVMYFEMKNGLSKEFADRAWTAAERIVDDVDYNDDLYVEYKGMRDYLEKRWIQIPEALMYDEDFAEYMRDNSGRMRFRENGSGVEAVYKYLRKKYPKIFTEDLDHPVDMLLQMDYALDLTEPYRDAYSSEEYTDLVKNVAESLCEMVRQGEEYRSVADDLYEKFDARSKAMRQRHNEAKQKIRDQYGEKIASLRQTLAEKNEAISDLKAENREALANARQEKKEAVENVRQEEKEKRQRQSDRANKWKEKYQQRIQHDKEVRETKKEKKMHRALYDAVLNEYNDLTKRLLKPSKDKKKNIPEQLRQPLAEMLYCFDLEKERSKKLEEQYRIPTRTQLNFRQMKDSLEKVIQEDETAYEFSDIHKFLKGKMTEIADKMDMLGDHSIDALDNNDIAVIKDLMKGLNSAIKNYQQFEIDGEKYEAQQIADKVGEGAKEHESLYGKGKKYTGARAFIDNIVNMGELTPIYFFKQIKGMYDMYRQIRKGFDSYVRNEKVIIDKIAKILAPYYKTNRKGQQVQGSQIEEWRHLESAETFKTTYGSLTLTIAQRMSLYCLYKRDQARNHMLSNRGGVVASEITAGSKMHKAEEMLKGKTVEYKQTPLTPEDVENIIATLTPEQIKIADDLQELMSNDMSKLGNQASMKLTGIEMYKETEYFPIKIQAESKGKDLDNIGMQEKVRNPGFSNPLQEHASNPIILDDIFTVVASHCNEMNLYASYAVPLTSFMKVYNGSVLDENGDAVKVQTIIKQTYGEKAIQYIDNFLDDINGNSFKRHGGLDDVLDKALGQAKKASVFANLRVALQQPTAIVRAFAVMNPKYFAGVKPSRKATQEMFEHCPIAQWKSWGYYDTHFGRDIEDVMMGANVSSKMDVIMSDIYGEFDNMTWGMIWQAVKKEVKAENPKVDEGTQEFWDLCSERASYVFDMTQVVDSPFHRSNDMRSKNGLVKQLTSFQAEPTLSFNVLRQGFVDAYEEYKKGNKAKATQALAKVLAVWTAQAVTVAIAQSFVDALRRKGADDDEDPNFFALWWQNFMADFVDDINPINNVYYFKEIVPPILNALTGQYVFGQQNLTFQWVDTLTKGIQKCKKKWEKGEEYKTSWYDCLTDLFGGIGYLIGVPVKTMMRGMKNAVYWFNKITGAEVFADDGTVDKAVDSMVDKFRKEKTSEKGSSESDSKSSGEESAEDIKSLSEDTLNKLDAKAEEKVKGYAGSDRDEVLWDVLSDGYTKHIQAGDMDYIYKLRVIYQKHGGNIDVFNSKVADAMPSIYKKTFKENMTEEDIRNQEEMRDFMLRYGMSETELSDICYHTDTAKDLKAALRMGNEKYIIDELVPLITAGLTREDFEKLYKNRNRGANTYSGKYTDPKYTKTTGTFVWPTDGVITSHFGYRDAPTAGASSNHPAIDIGASQGTPVVAADGGVVISAGANGGYGNSVGIKHSNGMVTYYNHLYAWNVKVGDQVGQGQQIGQVGSTGISTGPHLDFKILDADGNPVDPEKYLNKRS